MATTAHPPQEQTPRERTKDVGEREDAPSELVSDARTSVAPGGPGQIEQEPARGRHLVHHSSERTRSDNEIRALLAERVAQSDELDASDVQLIVSDGVLTMLGTVPDYAMKRRFEELAEQIEGVREVRDQLRVERFHPDSSAGFFTTPPNANHRK